MDEVTAGERKERDAVPFHHAKVRLPLTAPSPLVAAGRQSFLSGPAAALIAELAD